MTVETLPPVPAPQDNGGVFNGALSNPAGSNAKKSRENERRRRRRKQKKNGAAQAPDATAEGEGDRGESDPQQVTAPTLLLTC